jgi:formylglycine-generating enzyme required for sulfatase activity
MKVKAKYKFKVHKKSKKGLTWEEAKAYCESLGNGWRLPTRVELLLMYENKEEIGGIDIGYYWSSSEVGNNLAWRQYIGNGYQNASPKLSTDYVRAVKDIN